MAKKGYDLKAIKAKLLHIAAKMFLTEGYEQTTIRRIVKESNLSSGTVTYVLKTKENIVCDLVEHVLEGQFDFTKKLIEGKTDDQILFYAAETTLQLYMAESNEHMRKLYNVAYSLPNSSEIIYHRITEKLENIFKESLPEWQTKDFYEREIASAGVMRNYMSVPCDMYSVLEYAYNKLGQTEATATEDDSLKALLKAMLAYGAAAQTHFNYKTDNLASEDDFTYVRVANATFEDGFDYGLFKAGSTVTVTPDEGYGLSASGNSIFTENTNGTLTLTVPADKTIDKTSIAEKLTVSEGLAYSLSSDGSSYSVTGVGTCEDTVVVIPSTYEGKPVKSISSAAFQDKTALTRIVIPEGVTSIGSNAFKNCSSLTRVAIPESVTSIDSNAFINCSGLTRVDISDVGAWCGISFGVRESNPLYYARNLYLDGALVEDLVIPEGVTEIKGYAFSYTTSIKTVTIPASVKKIGGSFDYCTELTGVYITDIKAWIDIDMGTQNSLLLYAEKLYLNNVLVENLVLSADDGYTKVKNFSNVKCLKSITLPEGITEICAYAFRSCSNLQTVNIPTTLKTIGNAAFEGCEALQYNVYDNAKYLGTVQNPYYMLVKATDKTITSCTIHSDTKIIGSQAFGWCKITAIAIPDGVTEIHTEAFRGCVELGSIAIPDSVTIIDAYVFNNCKKLSTVTIGTGVTAIGNFAFAGCLQLTSIVIPNGVTYISGRLFSGCTALTSVSIGKNVNMISYNVFENCTALTTINFGGTTEQWGRIIKDGDWKEGAGVTGEDGKTVFTVVCTDGNISIADA